MSALFRGGELGRLNQRPVRLSRGEGPSKTYPVAVEWASSGEDEDGVSRSILTEITKSLGVWYHFGSCGRTVSGTQKLRGVIQRERLSDKGIGSAIC